MFFAKEERSEKRFLLRKYFWVPRQVVERQMAINELNLFLKKMGQSRPLFGYFRPFLITNCKKRKRCAWDSNPGPRMVGADETTEQWRPPQRVESLEK